MNETVVVAIRNDAIDLEGTILARYKQVSLTITTLFLKSSLNGGITSEKEKIKKPGEKKKKIKRENERKKM